MSRFWGTVAASVVAAVVIAAGQGPATTLRIVSPEDGSYVSHDVAIKATVDPPGRPVVRMTFFADGRLVCTVEQPPFECHWNAGAAIREHTFRVVAYLPDGRRIPQTVRSKGTEFADNADVDIVHVTVTVLDGNRFARGLDRGAFRVYEDGVRQPITYFGAENTALELVTAVDVSESMTAAIEDMKGNVKHFLSALRPADRVTLVAFNENFFLLAQPAVDLAARLKAVDRLAPWGSTSLHDMLMRCFDLLGRQSGRRGMVIFTDGDDTSSRVARDAVERRAETSDAVMYMIGQGRAIESRTLKDLCERLAQKSGGRAFFPKTMEDVRRVFDEVVDELSNQYLLGYVPPSQTRDAAWHRITVEVPGTSYQIRARQGYRFKTSE